MVDRSLFKTRLNDALRASNVSQKDLAELVNIAPQSINKYCKNGDLPTAEIAVLIAEALNVSLDYLFDLDVKKEEHKKQNFTLADVATLIAAMDESLFYIEFDSVERDVGYPEFSDYRSFPSIVFRDSNLAKFIDDYIKIKNLLNDGTIDEEMFGRWLDGRICGLSNLYINDLPF